MAVPRVVSGERPRILQHIIHVAVMDVSSNYKGRAMRDMKRVPDSGKVEPLSKKWVSNSEARKYLGCSAGYLQNLRETGRLPYHKVRSMIFYKVSSIDRLIEKGKVY